VNKYHKTLKGKAVQIKANSKYRKSDKGRLNDSLAHYRYRKTPLGKLKSKNRSFLNNAIRDGNLIRRLVCNECKRIGNTEFHHKKYHDPPQLKDIEELCHQCHVKTDIARNHWSNDNCS